MKSILFLGLLASFALIPRSGLAVEAEQAVGASGTASATTWYDGWGAKPGATSSVSIWGEKIASWALPVQEGISSGAGSIHDWASRTWTDLGDSVRNGRCRECGAPTLLNRDRCFHCMQRETSEDFLRWLDETKRSAREALRNLRDPKLTEPVIERLLQARDYFRSRRKNDPAVTREHNRQMLELLGRMRLVNDGRTINEIARDTLKTYAPALEGTDYIEDPARAISYFLVLDPKGFLEKVRCVRLRDGRVLTPIEAYQEYSGTDPAKAKEMLEIIEDIRQISSPLETDENRIPAALDALARLLRLMSR